TPQNVSSIHFKKRTSAGRAKYGQPCSRATVMVCHQTFGLVNGQTAAQVRQLILYFSMPLKTTLSPKGMLLVGQVLAHLRQILQKSSTPISTGSSATSGRSVRIGSGM